MSLIFKGEKITAAEFNELLAEYGKYWTDVVPTSAFTDVNKDDHGYGWGQPDVEPTVAPAMIIESEHWNRLVAQVNAGLFHITGDQLTLLNQLASGTPVLAANVHQLQSKVQFIDYQRFEVADAFISSPVIEIDDATYSSPWNGEMTFIARAEFSNYNEARYFFNSGGYIFFDLAALGSDVGGPEWAAFLSELGQIRITADQVLSEGNNPGVNLGGFYESLGSTTGYQTIWQAAASMTGTGSYGGYGGYGGYVNRLVTLQAMCEELPGGEIVIKLKIVLADNSLAIGDFNNFTLYADVGYAVAVDAPTSLGQPAFSAGTYEYQFAERIPPMISIEQNWLNIPE